MNISPATFRHFLMGAAAVIVPALPTILASPVVLHFIENHPVWAIYFPILGGIVAELYHRFVPGGTPAPVKEEATP